MSANTKMLTLAEVTAQLNAGGQIEAELVEIFSEEAEEHMRTIYDGLDRLRVDRSDNPALADVRRASHTLKGASAAVGMEAVTRLSHRMEDMLDYVADHNLTTTDDQIGLLLSTADQLQDLTTTTVDINKTAAELVEIYAGYVREMERLTQGSAVKETVTEAEVVDGADLLAEAKVLHAEAAAVEQAGEGEAMPEIAAVETEQVRRTAAGGGSAKATQYLRVPLNRLDDLVNVVGEMMVNRSAFDQRLADFESRIDDMNNAVDRFRTLSKDVETRYSVDALRGRPGDRTDFGGFTGRRETANSTTGEMDSLEFDRYTEFHLLARTLSETTNDVSMVTREFKNVLGDFDSLLGRQQRLNRDAQDGLMRIRMVPVSNIVSRLDRTVRSVSTKLSKKVNLVVLGEQTQLDKTVLEEIADPLQHLIRNAIDHGVETASERAAAGKPANSQLTIEALNQGTQVTIRISDDGRGVNIAKVRKQAVERGLIAEGQELSESELHDLLFMPGFSTADSLTDVSGRGVGMDVVRDAVQRLKGSIRLESQPGQGATFTIHLPTTLAISRALLVQASGQTFAVPMQSVQQVLRLDPAAVSKVGQKPIVKIGANSVQLSDMASHLQLRSEDQVKFDHAAPVLVLQDGDDQIAITVDTIEGSQDIVVKTLGDHLRHVPGLLGATVRGDGSVIPILDPADLADQARTRQSKAIKNRANDKARVARRNIAMVIDDSISVRRVTTNLLRSAGWDVVDAKDGIDALEKLANMENTPDVFLTDMEMPRMDGIELISCLRSQAEFADSPIVMVTSRASEKHRLMAQEAGANDHVVKPFNDEALLELLAGYATEARETVGA